ncbi:protein required for normal CLN1 and CLN2 G1 cyclin expression [Physocladia obscura]|uniref:Protein required for normal CLN1 and CLN2 G1 cyclin expression n=1 Tax=Physocladia obscura TaxID=109957 RepID=A0AAD5T638_9FUNG|nr:protein required for normal CLN1 and CLN2 G1 cyclin expression [Physocladia obscura]
MGRSIEIPLPNQDEVIIIDTDDLGTDAAENDTILKILTNEKAPLHLYLEFAKEFHRLGNADYVEKALEMGAERGATEGIKDMDYMKILHTLALHFIKMATSITKPDQGSSRSSFVTKATELLNRVENIDPRNVWTAIVRGNLYLANAKVSDSLKAFAHALNDEPKNLAALVGLGAAQLRSQDFKSALKTYQKILTLSPEMKPDPRLAIGICYHRLQMIDESHTAFSRAVELDPENPDALALIARVEWNQSRVDCDAESLEQAIEKVKIAFQFGRKNANVLNLISEGFFFKGFYDKAEITAKAAISNADSNIVKAEAYGIMAKSLHLQVGINLMESKGKFSEALEMYSKAAALNPSSVTYQFGLGQMYIYQGEHQKSVDCFEKVLAKDPENLETLKKAASICSDHPKLADKSLAFFGRLQTLIKKLSDHQESKDDVGLFPEPVMQAELAKLYESSNPAIALKGYLHALSILEADSSDLTAVEILNNIGALYHRDAQTQSDYNAALSYYERALLAAEASKDSNSGKYDLRITIKYNMARLHEAVGQLSQAKSEYQSILEEHPSYFDCYLRLASMTTNFEESRAFIRKGLFVDRKSSLLMLGTSFFEDLSSKLNLRDSRKTFEEVLQKADKHDHYALCNIGNIYLVIARFDPKQKELHVKKALEFFDKAVRVDSKNIFGATGVGICLAELGHFESARDVFTQVLEGAVNMPSVSINLAHVLVELGQTKLAIMHYERVLKKTAEKTYVLQCLARVYYIVAKTEKDPVSMLKSLNCIQRAIRNDPGKSALWYDLALVKQQYAQIMNDQSTDKRTVAGLKIALEGLQLSHRIFSFLSEKKSAQGYDVKQAEERADYSKAVQRISEKKIHETSVFEEQRSERLQAIKSEQLRVEKLKKEADIAAKEKLQREREDIERARREIMQKVKEDNKKERELQEFAEEEEAKKPSKRKKLEDSDESEADGNGLPDDENKKKKKRRDKKKEENGGEKSGKKRRNRDEEDAAMRVGKPSTKSKAIVDSDEDE